MHTLSRGISPTVRAQNLVHVRALNQKGDGEMISDETAYRRYTDGDESAAEVLVEKYGDALVLYISGYLKDVHEAEDLMIEAFSRVFAKERPIVGDGAFKAYLFKTARNLALRHVAKRRGGILRFHDLNFEPQAEVFTETEIIRDERTQQLYSAMEKLKNEYREALYLVYFGNMSYRGAATVMGKNEQQLTKLIYRGKQKLKNLLEQEEFNYADE